MWFPNSPTAVASTDGPISDRAAFISGKAELGVDAEGKLFALQLKARSYQKSVPPSVKFDVYADIVTREAASTITPSTVSTNSTASNSTMPTPTPTPALNSSSASFGNFVLLSKVGSLGIAVGWRLNYQVALGMNVATDFAWVPQASMVLGIKHSVGGTFGSSQVRNVIVFIYIYFVVCA